MIRLIFVFFLTSSSLWGLSLKVSEVKRNHFLKKIYFNKTPFPYPNNPHLHYPYDDKDLNQLTPSELNKISSHTIHCQYLKRKNNGTNPKFRCWLTNRKGQLINGQNQIISPNSSEKIEKNSSEKIEKSTRTL